MTHIDCRNEHEVIPKLLAGFAKIPEHDPSRYETTDGLDNARCTNGHRALFAAEALDSFQSVCGMDENVDTAVSDLICDLLHLLHSKNCDPSSSLRNGIEGFLCEAGHLRINED